MGGGTVGYSGGNLSYNCKKWKNFVEAASDGMLFKFIDEVCEALGYSNDEVCEALGYSNDEVRKALNLDKLVDNFKNASNSSSPESTT